MRWSPLARKECRAVATSKGVWLLAIFRVIWGSRPSYVGWDALGANITVGYVQVAGTALLEIESGDSEVSLFEQMQAPPTQ
jgi:hypothetical protein